MKNSMTFVLSGEAGQGLQTIEDFLIQAINKTHYVYTSKEVMSRVRGGNNTVEIRVSDQPVYAYSERIDVLFLMNNHSLYRLKPRIDDTTVIFGSSSFLSEEEQDLYGKQFKALNVEDMAAESGSVLFGNTILFGFIMGMLGIKGTYAKELIAEKFANKNERIQNGNQVAYTSGHQLGINYAHLCQVSSHNLDVNFKTLTGTEAVGIGALAGGCNFVASYPMSPSTGVLIYLAQQSETYGVAVEQAEDEIAALNMVIGSWYAGARGLATTSGGGFALMQEAVSLSGITETPFVLHLAQRPGPGTGLPTRTGQEDLNLVVYSGHGEFPRIVLAPGNLKDGIELTSRAFYLADKYQVPVFVLTDQFYLDSKGQLEPFDISDENLVSSVVKTEADYKRYRVGDTGLSPRGIPNHGLGLVKCDSDEHDENGMITESFDVRITMNDKRLSKEALIFEDYIEPELIGPSDYKNLLVGWGSTYGVIKEFVDNSDRQDTAFLYIKQPYPLAPLLSTYFNQAEKVINIENNATGQLGNLLKLNLDVDITDSILKYNGEPFSIEELNRRIKEVL